MITSKRVLLGTLVVALAIAIVPLWGRTNVLPCMFVWHPWRYAISYGPPRAHLILPENSFPRQSPLCLDLLRRQGYNI